MLKIIKNRLRQLVRTEVNRLDGRLLSNFENLAIQNGRLWTQQLDISKPFERISDIEFKVFSQWGDDGIIQFLINYLDIDDTRFVEFGVEDYLESNTRFLLQNDNWSGLVLDGSSKHINKIKKSDFYWKFNVIAKEAFITKENINTLIKEAGFDGEIGLLHIDIDGNDYWIWKSLEVVQPIIMIVEYNSVFGKERAITVPYKSDFVRSEAHHSNLYAGASLKALCDLAQEKGYFFIGSNSAGNNAYFVKKSHSKELKSLSCEQGYVTSQFREARDTEGNLIFLSGEERVKFISGMPIFNTQANILEKL